VTEIRKGGRVELKSRSKSGYVEE